MAKKLKPRKKRESHPDETILLIKNLVTTPQGFFIFCIGIFSFLVFAFMMLAPFFIK